MRKKWTKTIALLLLLAFVPRSSQPMEIAITAGVVAATTVGCIALVGAIVGASFGLVGAIRGTIAAVEAVKRKKRKKKWKNRPNRDMITNKVNEVKPLFESSLAELKIPLDSKNFARETFARLESETRKARREYREEKYKENLKGLELYKTVTEGFISKLFEIERHRHSVIQTRLIRQSYYYRGYRHRGFRRRMGFRGHRGFRRYGSR